MTDARSIDSAEPKGMSTSSAVILNMACPNSTERNVTTSDDDGVNVASSIGDVSCNFNVNFADSGKPDVYLSSMCKFDFKRR